MGYVLTRIFSVSPSDRHSYFVYYVPEREPYFNLSKKWITDWVHSHFADLARGVGPDGVLITPAPDRSWHNDDIAGLHEFFSDHALKEDMFLHGHMPFLIVSRAPLEREAGAGRESIAINLVNCHDDNELAKIFDSIFDSIRRDDFESIIENFPMQEPAKEPDGYGGWLDTLNKVVHLKPNMFGLGINLNEAIAIATERLLSKSKRS